MTDPLYFAVLFCVFLVIDIHYGFIYNFIVESLKIFSTIR